MAPTVHLKIVLVLYAEIEKTSRSEDLEAAKVLLSIKNQISTVLTSEVKKATTEEKPSAVNMEDNNEIPLSDLPEQRFRQSVITDARRLPEYIKEKNKSEDILIKSGRNPASNVKLPGFKPIHSVPGDKIVSNNLVYVPQATKPLHPSSIPCSVIAPKPSPASALGTSLNLSTRVPISVVRKQDNFDSKQVSDQYCGFKKVSSSLKEKTTQGDIPSQVPISHLNAQAKLEREIKSGQLFSTITPICTSVKMDKSCRTVPTNNPLPELPLPLSHISIPPIANDSNRWHSTSDSADTWRVSNTGPLIQIGPGIKPQNNICAFPIMLPHRSPLTLYSPQQIKFEDNSKEQIKVWQASRARAPVIRKHKPIIVNGYVIDKEHWAKAFVQSDLCHAAGILFKALFSPEEIQSCTLRGRNGTHLLDMTKRQAIFLAVGWMKNKNQDPYSFNSNINSDNLTAEEKLIIEKKVFVERRYQTSRKIRDAPLYKKLHLNERYKEIDQIASLHDDNENTPSVKVEPIEVPDFPEDLSTIKNETSPETSIIKSPSPKVSRLSDNFPTS